MDAVGSVGNNGGAQDWAVAVEHRGALGYRDAECEAAPRSLRRQPTAKLG